jgi:hypothetical protein
MAGIFFPSPEGTLPIDVKRELFEQLSSEIAPRSGSGEARKKRSFPISNPGEKPAVKLAADAVRVYRWQVGRVSGIRQSGRF